MLEYVATIIILSALLIGYIKIKKIFEEQEQEHFMNHIRNGWDLQNGKWRKDYSNDN